MGIKPRIWGYNKYSGVIHVSWIGVAGTPFASTAQELQSEEEPRAVSLAMVIVVFMIRLNSFNLANVRKQKLT